jgi:hypothetical protein
MNSRRHHSDESPERSSATTRTRMECLSLSHVFESARLPEFPRPRERPPYHNKGTNETRRRNRLQSAKNSSLCERYCWGGCRKVPELTEEFAKQKSQKHEIRQIFNSWRREWETPPPPRKTWLSPLLLTFPAHICTCRLYLCSGSKYRSVRQANDCMRVRIPFCPPNP